MKKFILMLLVFGLATSAQAQTMTKSDINYVKKIRQIKKLEKQIDTKSEEMRVALSTLRTTLKTDINTLKLQLDQAEADLEALTQ